MRLRFSVRMFVTIAAGVVFWSCGSTDITIGGPIDLQINGNSPVSVGDSLEVEYTARGRSLLGLAVVWGDTQFDSVFMNGATSAQGTVGHVYADTGTYTVTARLVDQIEGNDEKTITVRIDP